MAIVKEHKSRNVDICKLLSLGKYTLEEIGEAYGISRERVRQIYKRKFHKGYRVRISIASKISKERKKLLLEEKKAEWEKIKDTVKYNCRYCKNPVTYREAKRRKYVCPECYQLKKFEQRNPLVTYTCSTCGKHYHPFIHSPKSKKGWMFCSNLCFTKRRSEVFSGGERSKRSQRILSKVRERVLELRGIAGIRGRPTKSDGRIGERIFNQVSKELGITTRSVQNYFYKKGGR